MNDALVRLPIGSAKFPVVYENARQALTECSRIDECADWANKAEALASYAKQSDDETLMKMAMRIKARAIDRCGALLRQIEKAAGKRTDLEPGVVAGTRSEAAKKAGLSKRQQMTAMRVNAVPRDEFETMVERDRPATVTELAKKGTKPAVRRHVDPRAPGDIKACVRGNGAIRDFVKDVSDLDVAAVVRGTFPSERSEMRRKVAEAIRWLQKLQAAQKTKRHP